MKVNELCQHVMFHVCRLIVYLNLFEKANRGTNLQRLNMIQGLDCYYVVQVQKFRDQIANTYIIEGLKS